MKRCGALAVLVPLLGGAFAACAEPRPAILHGPSRPLTAEDYRDVLASWTRSAKLYQGLENKLFVTVTYHAPELRRAFAIAFPEIYGHGGKITRRELVDLMGDVEQHNNFFVSMYTPEIKWNDLAASDSIWRVTLINSDEVAVGAREIIPIKVDANLRAVYPYIGRFDKTYLIRFPLTDPMNRLTISDRIDSFRVRIASALGVAEMTWELARPRQHDL